MSDPYVNQSLRRELGTFAEIGKALWADESLSERFTVETLSAVTLMDIPRDRLIERATSALLQRAVQHAATSNTSHLNRVFFRLSPEARFALSALHLGRWSYSRIGRILEISPEQVEALAWTARTVLGAEISKIAIGGAKGGGFHCPEYDLNRPWTQRFLDEEISSGQERIFLQNHLMACNACRIALNHCRDLYFAVERFIPRTSESGVEQLEALCKEGRALKGESAHENAWDALKYVLKKPDVLLVFSAAAALIAYRFFHH
jgi:hypothetical protein